MSFRPSRRFCLPQILPSLRAEWPALKLILREETTPAACDSLARGRIDCVILALPYRCGEIESVDLFRDPLFVAFPKGEFTPVPDALPVSDIDAERLLLLEDGHCLKDHALAACRMADFRADATMLGTSLHTIVQMVDNGLGITFLPKMAIDAGILDSTELVARPLRAREPWRRIALAWRKGSARGAEFHLLAEALQAAQTLPRRPRRDMTTEALD